VSEPNRIDLGKPTIIQFHGPDAVRFLNGQVTQDVRLVAGTSNALPSCVTDAKGKLQFRVMISSGENPDTLWVSGLGEWSETLEARLTRYLIADDVVVTNRTGEFSLSHLTTTTPLLTGQSFSRQANRFGMLGADVWSRSCESGESSAALTGDALEHFRITRAVAGWGTELRERMLPPEALLDRSDVSFQKGCYIGQEVISRIKSAGKVNRQLKQFSIEADFPAQLGPLVDAVGAVSGELTSISPLTEMGVRLALGFAKRGATEFFQVDAAGVAVSIQPVSR
jgi:tRNA-modifying protein YgfZ